MKQRRTVTVIILAAGRGSRLSPLTDSTPKPLLKVCGRSFLERALSAVAACREGEWEIRVAVVVGYRGGQIAEYARREGPGITIVWNHEFAVTNNMYSLFLGLSQAAPGDTVVAMNADCVYEPAIVMRAVKGTQSAIIVDTTIASYPDAMKIERLSDGGMARMAKTLAVDRATAVSCDLYRVASGDVEKLRAIMMGYLMRGDVNQWAEVALSQAAESGAIAFGCEDVEGAYWREIDTLEDLQAVELSMPVELRGQQ